MSLFGKCEWCGDASGPLILFKEYTGGPAHFICDNCRWSERALDMERTEIIDDEDLFDD